MHHTPIHLLVIDDSRTDRELLQHSLSHQHFSAYTIAEVTTAEEGLHYCQSHDPMCIIIDYSLPDMDGLELLRQFRLQPHLRFVPIIFLTGSGNEHVAVEALKTGAQDYLVKGTLDPHTLEKSIYQALETMHLQAALNEKQQELERQHRSFRMVAENAPDIIARFDRQGRHLYVNPAVAEITGKDVTHFLGKTNRDLGMPYTLVRIWEEGLAHIFATHEPYSLEFQFPDPETGDHFQSNMVPEYSADGQIVSVLAITRNISKQKHEEERKDTFIGMISHELRAPLASMKGNIQLAERRLARLQTLLQPEQTEVDPLFTETRAFLQRSLRQATIQNRLIQDLVDVSRLQTHQLELFIAEYDLGAIVEEVVVNQQASFPSRIINLDLPRGFLVWAMVDRDRIDQVMTNYVVNALKYSDAQEPVTVGMTIEKQQVCLWVKDHGPGLNKEVQQRIWERFYQGPKTQATRTGLGLGLSICKTLVEMHEGLVGVESTLGEGSTFWLKLPFHHVETIHSAIHR